MNQVEKYHSSNFMQARDAKELLEKFKPKMKWNGVKKIMDIGCGPGDVTYNYLFPLIPNNAELLGTDIFEPMIRFANSHYSDYSRLKFETLDVLDQKIVEKYTSNLDKIFSFFCFHWVQDQRRLFEHIYSILKPGGETLFLQTVDAIIYIPYQTLALSPKWSPYMKDCKIVIPPYRNSSDPVSEIKELIQSVGFHTKECYLESKSYTFPSKKTFYDWTEGISPFSKNIPRDLAKEYEREWKKIILDENLYIYNDATDEVTMFYSTLTVFAQKPY